MDFSDWPEAAMDVARGAVEHGAPNGWTAVMYRKVGPSLIAQVDMPWATTRAAIEAMKAAFDFDWWSGPVRVSDLRPLAARPATGPRQGESSNGGPGVLEGNFAGPWGDDPGTLAKVRNECDARQAWINGLEPGDPVRDGGHLATYVSVHAGGWGCIVRHANGSEARVEWRHITPPPHPLAKATKGLRRSARSSTPPVDRSEGAG